MAKLKVAKTHDKTYTYRNINLQRKKQKNQQMVKALIKCIVLVMKKEKQQTYNVIFVWDKKPNLNLKLNYKQNPKLLFILY